jgi:ABC-type multidrug transport system fused ATPase/permease subunit
MAALYRLMQGRTVLLITHRPIGLETMDQVIVLEQGRVLERGAHAELLAAGGRYAQLTGFLAPGPQTPLEHAG